MVREAVTTAPDAPAPVGPYSVAVRTVGGLVYLSGQTPIDPATGRLVSGNVTAQVERVFANLEAVLCAAGLTFDDVVKVNVYLAHLVDFDLMNEVYARVFTPPYPARTTIGVRELPLGARIEVEAIAQQR